MSRQITGKYYGTEINEKWWRRYGKNKMLARGNGSFSFNNHAISFLRQLTKTPITIDVDKVKEIKTGKWHGGQWGAGQLIIKILWYENNQLLSSGFSLTENTHEIDNILLELKELVLQSKNSTEAS